jgi:hypothetical protein
MILIDWSTQSISREISSAVLDERLTGHAGARIAWFV